MNANVIVSTSGTSVLSNKSSPEERKFLTETANLREKDLTPLQKGRIDEIAGKKKMVLLQSTIPEVRGLSAELNGLLGIYEENPSKGKNTLHFFIQTDTYQGRKSLELVQEWMQSRDLQTQLVHIPGLNTASLDDFALAMSDIVKWCDETLPGYRDQGYRVIFSLVGGFKSVQGFMQTLGMFYADESVYIFEGSREIIRLPRLPVDLDHGFTSAVTENIGVIRTLLYKDLLSCECVGVPDVMLFEVEGTCSLSPWGELVFNRYKQKEYGKGIFPPPSEKIRVEQKATEALTGDRARIRDFNERMDDLARFLESGQNIRRLDFKKIAGGTCPPCTHEIDLSADKGAWRIFGYYEGERFVIHHVGPSPLH
jgi:putative CRISPR-associated protein (TIGR02619 family)